MTAVTGYTKAQALGRCRETGEKPHHFVRCDCRGAKLGHGRPGSFAARHCGCGGMEGFYAHVAARRESE